MIWLERVIKGTFKTAIVGVPTYWLFYYNLINDNLANPAVQGLIGLGFIASLYLLFKD